MGLFDSWLNPWTTTTTDAGGNLVSFQPSDTSMLSGFGKGLQGLSSAFGPAQGAGSSGAAPTAPMQGAFGPDPAQQIALSMMSNHGKTLRLPSRQDLASAKLDLTKPYWLPGV